MDTPEELAAAFKAQQELGLRGGMLVTNPDPRGVLRWIPTYINKAIARGH